MIPPQRDRLLRPKKAAELVDVTERTIRRWVAEGRLPAVRLAGGNHLRVRESDLDQIMRPADTPAGRQVTLGADPTPLSTEDDDMKPTRAPGATRPGPR